MTEGHTTGIALFVYNRPEHTKQVLGGLKENGIDHLYVFSDGPKNKKDVQKVRKVREMINRVGWCKTTVTNRYENLGLSKSLISGINDVFATHDRIIVLEDDCVPSQNFISFMQKMFSTYEGNPKVMSVSGHNPINYFDDYSYDIYFTHRSSSWGWGTWKSDWKKYRRSEGFLKEIKNNKDLRKRVKRAGSDLIPMATFDLEDKCDSWAVWWSLTVAVNAGLCLNPTNSYITNIGHGSSGTHTKHRFWRTRKSNKQKESLHSANQDIAIPQAVAVNKRINKRYNQVVGGGFLAPAKYWIKDVLGLY